VENMDFKGLKFCKIYLVAKRMQIRAEIHIPEYFLGQIIVLFSLFLVNLKLKNGKKMVRKEVRK